jgi:hypothetical protein
MRLFRERGRLPSVTVGRLRSIPAWRLGLAGCGFVLLIAGLLWPAADPSESQSSPIAPSPGGVAVRIPESWLAAPPPPLSAGDRVDLVGVSPTERKGVTSVVVDARVLVADQDGIVVEAVPDDIAALAVARAGSYLLLLLLRP